MLVGASTPLDRLDLVVHRAVRAVHPELVAHERAARRLAQRRVRVLALVATVVDQLAAAAAPERQHDLLVVLGDLDRAHVREHRPRDHLGPRRGRERAPRRPVSRRGPHELVAGLAQRALDRLLAELVGDEGEQRRDPVDRVVLQPGPLGDRAVDQRLRGVRDRRRRSRPSPAPRAASPSSSISASLSTRSAMAPPLPGMSRRLRLRPAGGPSTRSAMMLRWISLVPPGIVPPNERIHCIAHEPSRHICGPSRVGVEARGALRPRRRPAAPAARSRSRRASAASARAPTCPP